ncbi:hypothetical protein J3T78_02560 [Staphylococcus nepalensis]|uniref:Uncharacterized protein n=1 Tax=Staphylococcus nepalensis TaxID=214473 RepID=A0ABS3L3P9_9STAP|nr:hypothetical protein [Staphylococcus nepalensis]MBO1214128.1 hypothetical protein [Staphylococcus nepalensis]MBO1217379.1 hypothetical protein [Staphylococcus nepalensis]MBO1228189.1 hypothetical protein [Staphylococcus nepalensis]MBO1233721.1 hypothetical protein [Staphylococcus nepalensis]MBO1236590.1 hypothetical protein [Staphylococcus nepalensis]
MKEHEIVYLKENFADADQFIELTMKNGKETVLVCKGKEFKIINLFIKKDEHKKKYVETHETIDEFTLTSNEKIVKDNFALSSKYNLNGKNIDISSDESKNKFEKLLIENGNTIENTKRNFINKIVGFRTKKVWKMIVAIIIYLMLLGALINIFTGDEESEDKKQDDKKEVATKEDKSDTGDKKKNNDKKSDEPKKEKKDKKPLTDEEKIKKQLKEENQLSRLKEIQFVDNGHKVTIELKGQDALSKKSTARSFKMQTADTLYALNKSGVNFETADVYISFPMTDGIDEEEKLVMTSTWSKETVKKIDKDSTYSLPDHIEQHADSFFLHRYFRE